MDGDLKNIGSNGLLEKHHRGKPKKQIFCVVFFEKLKIFRIAVKLFFVFFALHKKKKGQGNQYVESICSMQFEDFEINLQLF